MALTRRSAIAALGGAGLARASRRWSDNGGSMASAFTDLPREHGFEALRMEGAVPRDLNGTLFRNGAALFSLFGRKYRHWFDGDGAVSAVRFANGHAEGAVRLVATPGLQRERKAGKALYGVIGTPGRGLHRSGLMKGKNPANTSVLIWQQRMFALCEGGLPIEMSRRDLSTIGVTDFNRAVHSNLCAHPHYVPPRAAFFAYSTRYGARTSLDVFALPDRGAVSRLASVPLRFSTFIHDFIATGSHVVFFISPVRVTTLPLVLGTKPFLECLSWHPSDGTEVVCLPLDRPERPIRFTTDAFHQWHFANAFDRGGDLIIDLVRYPDFQSLAAYGRVLGGSPGPGMDGRLCRAVLTPAARTLRLEQIWDTVCEFPRTAPASAASEYRFVYVAAYSKPELKEMALEDALAKVDRETGRTQVGGLGAGRFPSEPVFAPRPGARSEDDGYVLSLVYDSRTHTSGIAVLDARDFEAGPLAWAWFDHHIPPTFHGTWQAA